MKDAYSEYIGSSIGRYHVTKSDIERYENKTLFDVRLDNYHKLNVKDFIGISFNEYINNPRWVIASFDAKCTKWSAASLVKPPAL